MIAHLNTVNSGFCAYKKPDFLTSARFASGQDFTGCGAGRCLYPKYHHNPRIMKKILVTVFKRQDQTLIHIITMYVTLVLAFIFTAFQLL
jgi:hypothetical protein